MVSTSKRAGRHGRGQELVAAAAQRGAQAPGPERMRVTGRLDRADRTGAWIESELGTQVAPQGRYGAGQGITAWRARVRREVRVADSHRSHRADVKDFSRKWTWVAASATAGAILTAALVSWGLVWWQRKELQSLAAERDKLSAEVNALQGQADQTRRNGARRPVK